MSTILESRCYDGDRSSHAHLIPATRYALTDVTSKSAPQPVADVEDWITACRSAIGGDSGGWPKSVAQVLAATRQRGTVGVHAGSK